MGSSQSHIIDSGASGQASSSTLTTGKKICCVCKETKLARDECVAKHGEEQCKELIDLHNQCLRKEGFTVN
ncbi:putative cytochrome c oxidase copper chaperone (COX17) [Babesia bovis T2Bo]|uniref:Cytochrome c oxidase copper chaperone (COX17), putative n=1 Tax=Babesia bovis TaxID=5865 RepID=A7ALZ7_BABBO|nr:putative cytochrome c oxidase copper chaperone (COX17) [Babesia bovis T2Bo]EDO07581.1 putative cytochrome c oxidase copper chaperone (COX17) [Babesia bovis T2Bo]|eukprot:XP_001611149.1 cytochrome c oxidase copper chaperone (COX17) [Babesia bovis T2Bo]